MSHTGMDLGDTESGTNPEIFPINGDTLNRKLPSTIFEKYVKKKQGNTSNESINIDTYKDKANEEDENDANDTNDTTGFILRLQGGSPALRNFKNPFDDSPDSADEKKRDHPGDDSFFKTPSKKNTTFTRSTPNVVHHNTMNILPKSTSTDALEELRAMRDRQAQNATLLTNFDTNQVGLVIDMRKAPEEANEDSSMDDSSIRLNLVPTHTRFLRNLNLQDTLEATQADGNVHDEVNRMLLLKNNEDDEDDVDAKLLKSLHVDMDRRFTYSSNDQDLNDDDGKSSGKSTNERISDQTKDILSPILKDTQDISETYTQNKNELQSNPKTPSQKVEFRTTNLLTKYSPIAESFDGDHTQDRVLFSNEHDSIVLKDTQVIDNFSQSLVLDDDEEEDNTDNAIKVTKNTEEDDDEEIKTGRNILQTFRIHDESQSQFQSQLQLQLLSPSQPQYQSQSPYQVRIPNNDPIPELDDIEVNGSEMNSSFGIPETQPLHIPDTQNVDTEISDKHNQPTDQQPEVDIGLQISSPVDLFINENVGPDDPNEHNTHEISENEIPNTSAISISKLYVDENKTEKSIPPLNFEVEKRIPPLKNALIANNSKATSTPIIPRKKISPINNSRPIRATRTNTRMMEKLSNVLRDEINDKNTQDAGIQREKMDKKYTITDVLDSTCIFVTLDSPTRVAGRIIGMVETEETIFVNVSTRDGDAVIEHTKMYAPIVFDIGDAVKYFKDRRSNYKVTGLKKTAIGENDTTVDRIETIDGFNKLLISKSKDKLEEIEVDLKDIYLTGPMCRNYKYKLFNNSNDFQKYLDYQIQQFEVNEKVSGKFSRDMNADETLINLLPASRNRSLMSGKAKGFFSRCLFVVTGLTTPPPPTSKNATKGDSKNTTPRHQKERDIGEVQQIVEFIQSQDGVVLQDCGFEDIIKFKLKEKFQKKTPGPHSSPRKNKIIHNNGFDDTVANNSKKNGNEYANYSCTKTSRDGSYYQINFVNGDSFEIDEQIANFEFGCVISSRHVRTLKYLECLCLKWPIIHVEFIKRCMENELYLQNWKSEWNKFLLISGEYTPFNCCIGLDIFQYFGNWIQGASLNRQVRLNKMFQGSRVVIIDYNYKVFADRIGDNGAPIRRKSKRRKVKKEQNLNESDSDGDNGDEDSDKKDKVSAEVSGSIDGPVAEETLLWIFRQVGFNEAIVIRDKGCNLRCLLGLEVDNATAAADKDGFTDDKTYVYFKYGNDMELFKNRVQQEKKKGRRTGEADQGVGADRMVNWEWVVQRIICNDV